MPCHSTPGCSAPSCGAWRIPCRESEHGYEMSFVKSCASLSAFLSAPKIEHGNAGEKDPYADKRIRRISINRVGHHQGADDAENNRAPWMSGHADVCFSGISA